VLARGDLVGVVATGFAVRRAPLQAGLRFLERSGFRVRLGEHLLARQGYLAGDDDARASDLAAMLDDPQVRAVWFARGGYGTARILDRVPWRKLRSRPRVLVGYSDLTALFAAASRRTGARCLYGPVVTELGTAGAFHAPSLRKALRGEPVRWRFGVRDVRCPGVAHGPLIGGNLSVLNHLLGTRDAPRPDGAILLLEEVGETAYRLDRMLTQLRRARFLERLAGVVLGAFQVPARRRFPPDRSWHELLGEFFGPLGVPVVSGMPAGHMNGKWTLPLGGQATLDTRRRLLRVEP
jgi:muramoyltetrapeptide carboxypeptidase